MRLTRIATVATITFAVIAACHAQETAARWIWYPEAAPSEAREESRWFRHEFDLPQAPADATLLLMVDDGGKLWVNGEGPLEADERERAAGRYDLTGMLRGGGNVLAVEVYNATGVAGVIARLTATMPDGREVVVTSDGSWRVSREAPQGWQQPGFDDGAWEQARVVGSAFTQPWHDHPAFPTAWFITQQEQEAHDRFIASLMAPPEQFADDPPLRAEAGFVNGSAALTLDGEPRPLVMYRGRPDLMTEHGRRQVEIFRDAGVHLYCPYVRIATCWTGPGEYDFSAVDRLLRMYLAADPDAYLVLMVRLVQPAWWTEAHPEEMVDYAVPGDLGGDETFRAVRGSMASKAWLHDTAEAWRALIEHVESRPWGKRVAGYHPGYGIYAEWHYFGSWRQQYPDTGVAMTARFREWLREKYGTNQALREAWGDAEVSLATAEVPGVEPRRFGELITLRDPALEQRPIDYYRCHQRVVADALERFARIAKDVTAGAKVCGAYYGYFYGVRPQTQGGHLELERLFRSDNLDYFVAPYSYSQRLMGDDGRLRGLAEAHRIAGKPHILEGDIRTYIHPLEEHGRTQNLTQSLAAITREFSTALIERAGYWWVDFGPEGAGGWFDDPAIMRRAERLQDVAERALQASRERTAQIALVADLESLYYVSDGPGMDLGYRLVQDVATEMYRTGAPFDAIHLDQLADADLERYRMVVFLNTIMLDPDEAALVRRVRESDEHVTVFLPAPGLLTEDEVSVAQAEEITGLELELLEQSLPGRVEANAADPLMGRLPPVTVHDLRVIDEVPVAGLGDEAGWYNPRDEETMQERYAEYATEAIEGGLRWSFETSDAWTDIHWTASEPFDAREGLGLDLTLTGEGQTVSLQFVIKDANLDEFCAPRQTLVAGGSYELRWPLAGFETAPWWRAEVERPEMPLRGCKMVVRDTANVGRCVLEMTGLRTLEGEVTTEQRAGYGSGAFAPALVPAEGSGRVPGWIRGTEIPAVVAVGSGRGLTLYSAVPFLPREVLVAAMEEAGVHRYIDETDDVLRADERFIALHTATGGERTLRLRRGATVTDALTGEALGRGASLTLHPPPNSTTLLELAPAAAAHDG